MSTGPRFPLAQAKACAQRVVTELAPGCSQILVAGSIRRGRPDVGDIEIVAVPRIVQAPDRFFETASALDGLIADSPLLERLSGGERYVKLRHRGNEMQVDLFVTTQEQFGLILLIRTGPADYSQWLVTELRRHGMHSGGGSLRKGLRDHSTPAESVCTCEAIPTPEERDVYTALGLPYVEPQDRHVPWERHA